MHAHIILAITISGINRIIRMRPGLILPGLHALASIIAWGVAMQAWRHIHWANDGTALLALIALLFLFTQERS